MSRWSITDSRVLSIRYWQESGFPLLHDKSGFKPFCFSNIFPFGDMKAGDVRHFLIASPGRAIIESLAQYLTTTHRDLPIHLGDCSFSLKGVRIIDIQINQGPVKIICATPILLRLPGTQFRSLCGARRGTQAPVRALSPADIV